MSRETQIAALVEKCLDHLHSEGGDLPIEQICAGAPELQDEVRRAVEVAQSLPRVGADAFQSDPRLGTLIADRYRLDDRLGAGAMGLVYGAMDLDLGRQVALKLMRTDLVVRDSSIARFEREATTLAAIQHEAVVTVFDRGMTSDGAPFLAMELIEGVPCSQILEEAERRAREGLDGDDDSGWLTESFGIDTGSEPSFLRQVLRWAADIASGLAAVHEAGVVHRDLKPSNIIIRPDNRAVLIDFGIATAEDSRTLTGEDELVGTPAYMAPEGLRRGQSLGPQADVYGLAATLYHLLTLQAPFLGSVNQILSAIATREPEPASRVRPGIPRGAQAILDHGMARAEGSRYGSLSAMESDIRALLAHRQVSVRPTSSLTRLMRRARRSKVLRGAAGAALVIAAALGFREWRAAVAESNQRTFEGAYPGVPALFGMVDQDNRFLRDPDLRADVGTAIGSVAECGHQFPTGLVLRAAFRLDHGDSEGALRDLAQIAQAHSDPAVAWVQAHYSSLADDPAAPLQWDPLPTASSPAGQYLLAFHLMRARRVSQATEALADPRLDSFRHALDLRLFLRAAKIRRAAPKSGPDQDTHRLADALVEDAEREIQGSGYGSATLFHAIGIVRLTQRRYADAYLACERGLAGAPASFPLNQNAADASLHLGELQRAAKHAEAALAQAPELLSLLQLWANIQRRMNDFDGARETLTHAPYADTSTGTRQRIAQLVQVGISETYSFIDGSDADLQAAHGWALGVLEQYPKERKARRNWQEILDALLVRERRPIFKMELRRLIERPTSLLTVQSMLASWPDSLDAEDGALLHEWIRKLGRTYEALVGVHRVR